MSRGGHKLNLIPEFHFVKLRTYKMANINSLRVTSVSEMNRPHMRIPKKRNPNTTKKIAQKIFVWVISKPSISENLYQVVGIVKG